MVNEKKDDYFIEERSIPGLPVMMRKLIFCSNSDGKSKGVFPVTTANAIFPVDRDNSVNTDS